MVSDPELDIRRALAERAAGITEDRLRFATGPRIPGKQRRWARTAPLLAAACVAVIGVSVALVAGRGTGHDLADQHGEPTTVTDASSHQTSGSQRGESSSGRADDQTAPATGVGFPPAESEAAAMCAGSGTLAVSDSGFNLATTEVGIDGAQACFFDGVQWWTADLATMPIRTAQITGVGRFVSQMEGEPTTSGRQLWVITDPEVRDLIVDFSDGYAGKTGAWEVPGPDSVAPVARFFLFRVPATGSATVTTTSSGKSVTVSATPAR